jgi:hypothetical protein
MALNHASSPLVDELKLQQTGPGHEVIRVFIDNFKAGGSFRLGSGRGGEGREGLMRAVFKSSVLTNYRGL